MMKDVLLVALGGAVGSVLRYLVSGYVGGCAGAAFPYGTFAVNVAGCLLIGMLTGLAADGFLSPSMRLLLVVGFCGGFTTFSTFANDGLALMKAGDALLASLYVGGSVAAGLFAAFVGMKITG